METDKRYVKCRAIFDDGTETDEQDIPLSYYKFLKEEIKTKSVSLTTSRIKELIPLCYCCSEILKEEDESAMVCGSCRNSENK